jgi:scaffold protein (connect acetoacetyl-CoA thiolase and HMG-CoA synthase)
MTAPADVVTLKTFFDEVRDGRLTGIRCGECRELAIPPKEFCPSCGKRAWTAVPLDGAGEIASFTVIRVAPRGHTADVPYAVLVVRLREGVSVIGRAVDIALDGLAVGMSVRFRPIVRGEHTLVGFGPAS